MTASNKKRFELTLQEWRQKYAVDFQLLSKPAQERALKIAEDMKLGHPSEYILDGKGNYIDPYKDIEKAIRNGNFLKSLKSRRISPTKALEILNSYGFRISYLDDIYQEYLSQIIEMEGVKCHENYQGIRLCVGDTVKYGAFNSQGTLVHISHDGNGIIKDKLGFLYEVNKTYRKIN